MKTVKLTFGKKVAIMIFMVALIGSIPLLILGKISLDKSEATLREESFHQLLSIREIKEKQITKVFADIKADLNLVATYVQQMQGNPESHQAYFNTLKQEHGYQDVYLVQPDGLVSYSVSRKADYRTNLISGPYKDTGLGTLFEKIKKTKEFGFAGYRPYAPSENQAMSFVGLPIFKGESLTQIVILQIGLQDVNEIMQVRDGMGETGESYLVGPDLLMRSDSFLDPQNHSVQASFANPEKGKVDTEASRQALQGKADVKIIEDYNGNQVLSAFTPIDVLGTTWALIAEIDLLEVEAPVRQLSHEIYLVGLMAGGIVVVILLLIAFTARGEVRFLTKVVAELRNSSNQVAVASSEISAGAQQLSQGATEQAASLEEISASMEQIAAQSANNATSAEESGHTTAQMADLVKQSHENSKRAQALSHKTQTSAEKGVNALKQISQAMKEIQHTGEKVNNIIQVINEITHQTKMLATNAAIEAARAGEQGKGFAVVADEVSKLAENSKSSAKEISELVVESGQKSLQGAEFVKQGDEVLQEIFSNASELNGLIDGITDFSNQQSHMMENVGQQVSVIQVSSREQSTGLAEVSNGLSQLDQVTQSNAAGAEESAASAEELNSQANSLRDLVDEVSSHFGLKGEVADASAVQRHFQNQYQAHPPVQHLEKPQAQPQGPSSSKNNGGKGNGGNGHGPGKDNGFMELPTEPIPAHLLASHQQGFRSPEQAIPLRKDFSSF